MHDRIWSQFFYYSANNQCNKPFRPIVISSSNNACFPIVLPSPTVINLLLTTVNMHSAPISDHLLARTLVDNQLSDVCKTKIAIQVPDLTLYMEASTLLCFISLLRFCYMTPIYYIPPVLRTLDGMTLLANIFVKPLKVKRNQFYPWFKLFLSSSSQIFEFAKQ